MTVSITPALLLLLRPQLVATTIVFLIFPTSQNTPISILFKTVLHSVPCGLPSHTDPELQAIVQGLEVSSPSFRAVFGVLFCGYDVSQGLRG